MRLFCRVDSSGRCNSVDAASQISPPLARVAGGVYRPSTPLTLCAWNYRALFSSLSSPSLTASSRFPRAKRLPE
eukprot:17086-Pyramimonas_sp.AAC.1